MATKTDLPRFELGQLFATPNALSRIPFEHVLSALIRHVTCDWGDVCKEDWDANDQSLIDGTRLLSVYKPADGEGFWIITEADRSMTTVLMPEDY